MQDDQCHRSARDFPGGRSNDVYQDCSVECLAFASGADLLIYLAGTEMLEARTGYRLADQQRNPDPSSEASSLNSKQIKI